MIQRATFITSCMLWLVSCSSLSCGGELPVLYTQYTDLLNIPVYDDHGRPINQIDQVASKVADHYSNVFPRITRSRLQNLLEHDPPLIVIMEAPLPCGRLKEALGCHYYCEDLGMNVIEVYWQEERCIVHTSMAHELVHYFDRMARGTRDPTHLHPALWYGFASVVAKTNNELMESLCEF